MRLIQARWGDESFALCSTEQEQSRSRLCVIRCQRNRCSSSSTLRKCRSVLARMDKPKPAASKVSDRREAILKTIERRDACKKRAAQIVEDMLEAPLSEEWVLSVLHHLSQQDYQDAAEERAIMLLCGYPLCNNKIPQVPKQKYHICVKSKKVYDITYRKQFCSDTCYRASNFLKAQLWDGPLWLRDEADALGKYKLYQDQRHRPRR
ncbi:putative RNA polymerase II subunit B1 CTD phosphatase RPAP2 homolog [Ixodes scapularis]|uniref:putative RNA polymerase II subunit B1 CTD phosphatase RPAP2 homolog n=1 Tax=Ixodes scapularis TaxID=6945 RepID=UPI001C3925DB|nr:putative RNA polymerase II subunit B1 CTD phosphatase RPAP2 homolog [Ixodes scapularis]